MTAMSMIEKRRGYIQVRFYRLCMESLTHDAASEHNSSFLPKNNSLKSPLQEKEPITSH